MTDNLPVVPQARVVSNNWESPNKLKERITRILDIMQNVMKPDVHYGKIPGCDVDSLFQPGSQLLSVAFLLGHEPQVEDLSDDDTCRYRVTDRVFDRVTGLTVGFGIGECSSQEDKYSWRRSVCDAEWEATDSDRRRNKYYKDGSSVKQVRTNHRDMANTVLKMARKRANVNGTIESLAASEVFTQDLEDMPKEYLEGVERKSFKSDKSDIGAPTKKAASPPDDATRKSKRWISVKQEGFLRAKCSAAKIDPEQVRKWLSIYHDKPDFQLYNITWLKAAGKEMS